MRLEGCSMQKPSGACAKDPQTKFPSSPSRPPCRAKTPRCGSSASGDSHPALIGYLRERGIDPAVAGALCREVHYAVGERRFFAIGFRNDAGGWELRSPQFKGSSAPKSITTFDRHGDTALLFEASSTCSLT